MEHVMIDLETLGTLHDSAFISIGACQFDPDTGKIGSTFHQNIDWDSAVKGRTVTGDTIKFWMRQSAEAQNKVCVAGKPMRDVLGAFARWFMKDDDQRKAWGNGAAFDIGLLDSAYDTMFNVRPWKHWNVRDVRTVVDLAYGKIDRKDFPFQGTQHSALDDAIHQATYVSAMWQRLRR